MVGPVTRGVGFVLCPVGCAITQLSPSCHLAISFEASKSLFGCDVLGWWDLGRRLVGGGVFEPQDGRLVPGRIAGHLPAPELEQRHDGLVERGLGRQVDLNGACGHGGSHPSPLRIPAGAYQPPPNDIATSLGSTRSPNRATPWP